MAWENLKHQLLVDEGARRFVYQDTMGYWTIGIGRNVDRRGGDGLSDDEMSYLLTNDLKDIEKDLDAHVAWWRTMTPVRQEVLMNMCFNMGIARLMKFRDTLSALEHGNWDAAASEMEDSVWCKEVGARAARLIDAMRKG